MAERNNNKKKRNIIVVALIFLVGIVSYLVYAYYPLIIFKLNHGDLTKKTIEYKTDLQSELSINNDSLKSVPQENMLVIPKIGVNAKIIEGNTLDVLNNQEGVWREPSTSNPERGSNMVIAGHRRQFFPPNTSTFYLLPELKEGDFIIVYWSGKEYKYKITESSERSKWTPEVYEKTQNTTLTLYTCSPLSTAENRWVIRAEQIL